MLLSSQVAQTYTILLQQTLEWWASGSAISPENQVIEASCRPRREKPKEELWWCRIRISEHLINDITFRVSFELPLMGKRPAQLGPASKSTSGMDVPSTKNSWILISQSKYFLDHFDIRDALGLEKVIFWTPPEDLALSTRGPLHLLAASSCRARNSLFLICRASTTELKRKTTAMSEKNTVESVLLVPMVLSWGWEFKLKLI